MNTELIGSIAQIVLMVVLAYPLGKYIAKVYKGEKTCLDFLAPMERWIFKICWDQSERGNELEKFLESVADHQSFLVFLGNALAVDTTIPASQPRWQWGAVVTPVVQYLHQFYGQL